MTSLVPTYGPGGDRLGGGGGRCGGGGEFLGSDLVVSDEAVRGQTEVRQELDEELVPLGEHRPARETQGSRLEG